MKLFYLIFLVSVALLSGCATNLRVTYDSDPPGAVLYQGQQKMGYTPYTLSYRVTDEDKARGYKNIAGTSVRWASGATAEIKSLRADLNQYGLFQRFNFERPVGAPGSDIDARFSLELERTRAMQRQAAAQEEQAAAQHRQAAAMEERARAESYRSTAPTNCTSMMNGNMINTSCY
jgi:hypothetical protein